MSLTISASAGDDSVCKVTKRASLLSCTAVSGVRCSTRSAPSSGQRVIPGLYSDSQTGQNMIRFQVSDFRFRELSSIQSTRTNLKLETWNLKPFPPPVQKVFLQNA